MPVDLPPWPADVPARTIRDEVHALAAAWTEALTGALPRGAVRGLYLKGSANKPWDSAIDYVPEHSDVDLHLDLRSPDADRCFDDLAFTLELAARAARAFDARVPAPLHRPKPQLTFIGALHALPGYVPSPAATVTTLAGEPYPEPRLDEAARAAQRTRDRESLLAHAPFVDALPRRAVDRPGLLLARLVDELSWRVSPTAPRVLSLAGAAYEDAWTANRSALVRRLEAGNHAALAAPYTAFYLARWRAFRAARAGNNAALAGALHEALVAGAETLRLGIAAAGSATA